MIDNMVTSLLNHGRIVTTVPKAKEVRKLADQMVTLAKRSSIHTRRQAFSVLRDRKVVSKLFDEIGPEFVDRNGGYTRIIRIGPRKGDAAIMSFVELVTATLDKPKPKNKSQKMVASESVISQTTVPKSSEREISESKTTTEVEPESTETSKELQASGKETSEIKVDSNEETKDIKTDKA
jgi:large subunit ribosomal protein L17